MLCRLVFVSVFNADLLNSNMFPQGGSIFLVAAI